MLQFLYVHVYTNVHVRTYVYIYWFAGGVPMFNIPSVVFPVAQFFLEDILQMTRSFYMHNLICMIIL